tara:strand:+ start:1250 stop:1801 length:552 start_codon:yes stop_codon:yes gene_type:complete
MCEPMTIAVAVAAAGTVMQGYAAQQQGSFENDVSKYNARQQDNEATRTRNKGTEEEMKLREKTAQLTSTQRAQLGASGVEVDSGSALLLQEDAELLGEADALRIRSNYGDAADSLEAQSDITRSQGKAALQGGQNAFRSSLLKAGGSVAAAWYTPASAGGLGGSAGGGSGVSNTSSMTNAFTA